MNTTANDLFINKKVLIRTTTAGIHYGTLISRDGKEVFLKNARNIWSWAGALSLNEIVTKGVNLKESKITEQVEELILTDVIAIYPIQKTSNLP